MKILLTGSNGYVGTRLLSLLLKEGHQVFALARRKESVRIPDGFQNQVDVIEGNLLKSETLSSIPKEIDAAYYLVHSMARNREDFELLDRQAAQNFTQVINKTTCKQIIYLTGLISSDSLSKHLRSRLEVETILKGASCPLTSLRAGIIIGSGSASFEIIRDLVEKLPIMVAPKWVMSSCQPIGISDVLDYLIKVLGNKNCLKETFDIGGPDILTYKEMLMGYAKARHLFRLIFPIPVLTPRLSSYWLILITSTNYFLARHLVESMKNNAVCQNHRIQAIIDKKCLSYQEALRRTLDTIGADEIISTWKESWSSSHLGHLSLEEVERPKEGCLSMTSRLFFPTAPDKVFSRIQQMGDKKGWCYMNWAWRYRGFFDRLIGGVGMRKGRRSLKELHVGDAVDFWRVLHLNQKNYHLILLAEMKLPGDAWLEFKIQKKGLGYEVIQRAIFRPKGAFGRIYWYLLYPIHLILFPGMLRKLVKGLR